jgi:Zn-dependent protease
MFGSAGYSEFDLNFQIFGIPVRVHPFFWLSTAFMVWQGDDLQLTLIGVLCIFFSVLIHELGHAFVIRRFGYPSEIVLYVFCGYATSSHFPFRRALAVSAAGPAAGLLAGALIFLAMKLLPPALFEQYPALLFAWDMLLFGGITVNLLNLVPVLPLDGGQIMSACVRQFGPRGRSGGELALQISAGASGLLALWAAQCQNSGASFIPFWFFQWLPGKDAMLLWLLQPSPRFEVIFMGYLCANSIIALKQNRSWQ